MRERKRERERDRGRERDRERQIKILYYVKLFLKIVFKKLDYNF